MSVLVYSEPDETVWEPSLDVATLFVEQLRSLERLSGTASGVSAIVSDEITVDPEQLARFIEACEELLENTNSGPLHHLAGGCLAVAAALHQRITGAPLPASSRFRAETDVLRPRWSLTRKERSSSPPSEPLLVRSPQRPEYQ